MLNLGVVIADVVGSKSEPPTSCSILSEQLDARSSIANAVNEL